MRRIDMLSENHNIMLIVNKILVVLYAFWYCFCRMVHRNRISKNSEEKNVLVIFHFPGFGDFICWLVFLQSSELACLRERGYRVVVALDSKLYNFLRALHLTGNYDYIPLNLELNNRFCLSLFKNNLKALKIGKWGSCWAMPRTGTYIKLLLMCIDVKAVSYVEYDLSYDKFSFDGFLDNFIKNIKPVILKYNIMAFEMYKQFFERIFPNVDAKTRIPYIKPIAKVDVPSLKYCIVNGSIATNGHAYQYRKWDYMKFAHVVDFIAKEMGIKVCFCGDKNDIDSNKKIVKELKNKNNVIDCTGRTSFVEWVELTRNAEFVLGNDSGYIHLAAAVGTQAFVIAGYWNYGRFLPYKVDIVGKDDKLPILINVERPPCTFCSVDSIIENNPEAKKAKQICDNCVARMGVYKCINDISVERAIDVIRKNYISK